MRINLTIQITGTIVVSDRPSEPVPASPVVDTKGQELADSRPGLRKCPDTTNVVPLRRVGGGAR